MHFVAIECSEERSFHLSRYKHNIQCSRLCKIPIKLALVAVPHGALATDPIFSAALYHRNAVFYVCISAPEQRKFQLWLYSQIIRAFVILLRSSLPLLQKKDVRQFVPYKFARIFEDLNHRHPTLSADLFIISAARAFFDEPRERVQRIGGCGG